MRDDPALMRELVDVVPAVVAERAHDQRRAEQLPDLRLRLPDPQLVDHVLRQVIALVDVELVDAERAQRRQVRVDRRAPAASEGQQSDGRQAAAASKRMQQGGERGHEPVNFVDDWLL